MLWTGLGCGRLDFDPVSLVGPDGATLDASTDAAAPRANLAFITAGVYDGALGGVLGADARCNDEAAAAGRAGDFIALLWSSERPDPAALFAGSSGWVRADGRWVVDTADQLVLGAFSNPLALTAAGDDMHEVNSGGPINRFWNGRFDGSCGYWRSTVGQGDQTWFPQWRRISDGGLPCSDRLRLACFERGHQASRPVVQGSTKHVFMTTTEFVVGGGVTAADALCNSDAAAAGLGPSRALIGTSTTAAIDRIPGARTTLYRRTDGVDVGLLVSRETWLNVDATGTPRIANVWTGGPIGSIPAATCADWTDQTLSAVVGTPWDYAGAFDSRIPLPCNTPTRLLCVEE